MRRRTDDQHIRLLATIIASLVYMSAFAAPAAWAGPPFVTDDPEPVEYRHGEFYISSQYADNKDGKEGTLPHFEFNYGAIPDVQLHLLVPFAYVHPNGESAIYGLGDTEVGVKYRFIHETDTLPQIGVFYQWTFGSHEEGNHLSNITTHP